jgi:hypothetical protein
MNPAAARSVVDGTTIRQRAWMRGQNRLGSLPLQMLTTSFAVAFDQNIKHHRNSNHIPIIGQTAI